MAIFFGNAKLIERYAETSLLRETIRLDLQAFGFEQFKNFWLFGYGSGAFGEIFKIFYVLPENLSDNIADHVHNDGIEFLGEVGVIGLIIIFILFISYFRKIFKNINEQKQLSRFILLSLLVLILVIQSLVDFSLHTPGIPILIVSILSIGLINYENQ